MLSEGLFYESRKLIGKGLSRLFLLLMALSVFTGFFIWTLHQSSAIGILIGVLFLLVLGILLYWRFIELRYVSVISKDGIYYSIYPLPGRKLYISWPEIESVSILNPLEEDNNKGKPNAKSVKRLCLKLKNGLELNIRTKRPMEMANAIYKLQFLALQDDIELPEFEISFSPIAQPE